ncbi:MAG: BatA domain-containing protein, partial [Marinirhabdus sp.]|nr:BatA domain-containing protein [Marinirhabdus sp.]
MQFKHPELLYALFLLLIPILIHLFQLRKFQKVAFTNVAFLKKVNIETRKSSQLKKWITLLLRLLALACIIIAFAQPFKASKTALNDTKETVIYLDNSFSMQAKGARGPLLTRAKQQLFDEVGSEASLHWLTNTDQQKNISLNAFKDEILDVPYSATQLTAEQVLLKADQLFSSDPSGSKRLVWISDFQLNGTLP